MNKLTSLGAAALAALVVAGGFATASNAQSAMTDQQYCHLLADKYTGGFKFGRSEVDNATAVAIAQCLQGDAKPAIPVLMQKLNDANIPVPPRI